jgi:hypothetical protein
MPNLEYSVRFVLASDSTAQIDAVLTKMRETGSTITVKVDADTSGFDAEMKKVEAELEKVEQTTQKMSRSASKTSGMYKILAKEISGALNQFKATGNLSGAQAEFARIEQSVRAFGASMEGNEAGMQEYYKLLNMNASAVRALDKETNNSSGVMKARQAEERALAEEVKRSAGVLRARAQSAKFDAKQQADANRMTSDSVTGVIRALQRLSVEGRGTAEEIQTYFGRTAVTGRDLQVTVRDLSAAFAQQRAVVEASTLPLKQREALLRSIIINERDTAQSIRTVNRSLAQQGQGVGDTSYAMMSFTRLLEDVPYGFRGFANNIQPTIYGLVQMNSTTEMLATRFRGLHGRELPLAARAMINLKRAVTGPVNQLLLLTSVVAVAGTMIERWSQSANKAKRETKELGDEFLRLYDVTKGDNPLDTDYSQSIKGLEEYASALESIFLLAEEAEIENKLNAGMSGASLQGAGMMSQQISQITKDEAKRLQTAKDLNKETRDRLRSIQAEADVQLLLLSSDKVRTALQNQLNERRVQTANDEILKTQELIDIEKVRQAQGEQAAIRYQSTLRVQAIQADATLNAEQKEVLLKKETIDLELELLRLAGRRTNEAEKAKAEYESTVQALQRQLQDETKMSSVQRLRVEQAREVADLEARHTEAKEKGAEIEEGLLEQEIELINKRYDLIAQREGEVSARIVANLSRQAMLSDDLVRVEQEMLFGDEARGIALDLQIQQMEYQNQLADKLDEIKDQYFPTDRIRLRTEENITREMRNQYNLSLMRQKADAMYTVSQFLSSPETEEMRIMQNAQQAMLASTMAFEIEKLQLKERFKNSAKLQEASLTALTEEQAKKRQQIERTAALQIALIRFAGYSQGLMMITSAFDQLNTSMEAKNRSEFERQKRFSASMATINTFLGVSQVLADEKLSSFMKFATATSMAITGFAQVRQILATKYGGASTGGFSAPRAASEGFVESDVEARGSINGTMNNSQPTMIVNVTGTVDKEGIAWAVMEGTDQINSRGIVLQ